MPNQILRPGTGATVEKAHLQFCKRYLEVNNEASNIACGAELGRFPLSIYHYQSKNSQIHFVYTV